MQMSAIAAPIACRPISRTHEALAVLLQRPCSSGSSVHQNRHRSCEDSPIGLDKWLAGPLADRELPRTGISSWEIHRAIGVTQKTAWFMLHRVRLAHAGRPDRRQSSPAKSKSMKPSSAAKPGTCTHKPKAQKSKALAAQTRSVCKGILERGGHIRAHVHQEHTVRNGRFRMFASNVQTGSHVYTDECSSLLYGFDSDTLLMSFNHAE